MSTTTTSMEVFREAPLDSTYQPISEHQAQTPASFYSGPPVLYHKSTSARLLCLKEESSRHPAIENLVKEGNTFGDSLVVDNVDLWVSSEKLIVWRSSISLGVTIPYPSISLHALGSIAVPENPDSKAQALYLEIIAADGFDDHDEEGSIALNFIPGPAEATSPSESTPTTDAAPIPPAQQLYDAVTDCANLHPDPVSPSSSQAEEEDDEEGPTFDYEVLDGNGLPPAFPGSGGWITSENMDQFFDEDGNWRRGGLGPGAGLIRTRDEEETEVNGNGHDVDGDEEETKWRRTG